MIFIILASPHLCGDYPGFLKLPPKHYFRDVKNVIKSLLQGIFGYRRYLRIFASFKVKTLRSDKREDDFFYFLSLLPEDARVLDIGANLGFLAVHIARRVTKGEVIAFEPMPDNIQALNHVIHKFHLANVRVETCALGDHNGEVEMVLPVEGKAKQQGLSHVVHEKLEEHNDGVHFKVPLKKLDDLEFLSEDSQGASGKKVGAIKMDVENFEQYVLAGAGKILAGHRPLIYIELWDNENRERCFEIVKANNYSVKVHVNGGLENFDPANHAGKINFFFVP